MGKDLFLMGRLGLIQLMRQGDGGGAGGGGAPAGGAPAPAGGAPAPAPTGGEAPAGGAPAGEAPLSAVGKALADRAAADAAAGDGKKEGEGEGEGEAKTPEQLEAEANEPLAIDLGADFKAYEGEVKAFSDASAEFLSGLKSPAEKLSAKAALNWASQYQAKAVSDQSKAMQDQIVTQVSNWDAATKKDAEIGGANYETSVADSVEFLRVFGTPELIQVIDESGLGSHPEVIRAFAKAGKLAKESEILVGGKSGESRISFSKSMYSGNKKG